MGLVLGIFVVVVVFAVLFFKDVYGVGPLFGMGCAVVSILSLLFLPTVVYESYSTYISLKTTPAVYEQKIEAIKMYKNNVKLDDNSFTDNKYTGYQTSLKDMITEVSDMVVKYNTKLIQKRIMNDNFMFSWLIIAPDDDMKPIDLRELNNLQLE